MRVPRARAACAALLASLALSTMPLPGAVPLSEILLSEVGTVQPGIRIDGFELNEHSGWSVSGAGDVNGDGLGDVITGAPLSSGHWSDNRAGRSHVVFGRKTGTVDFPPLGTGGFIMWGGQSYDYSGWSVSGAGDVNGDGPADLIVGAYGADTEDYSVGGGISYVVFGRGDGVTDIDLLYLGQLGLSTAGFRIDGMSTGDRSGYSVSGAGDVNGDGLADLIVGAYDADPGGDYSAGQSYVVFGKGDGATIKLGQVALGSGGFRIDGISPYDKSGRSVSGAGDVNGDGLADLIVGAFGADPGGVDYGGESYVVFGKGDGSAVDLGALGTGGFRIEGYNYSCWSVAGAGDVNGDGLADLVIGAPNANVGKSFVVFGKGDSAPVSLSALGAGGFLIDGYSPDSLLGRSVAGAGDVNGDGYADVIVGAPGYGVGVGRSYVVYGKADTATVAVATTFNGFVMTGRNQYDFSGWSVSGAGDVNGDGLADLTVGAYGADPVPYRGSLASAGESYVIFSPLAAPGQAVYRGTSKGGAAPLHPIGVSGDGSNNDTPDSRVWVGFQNGDIPSQEQVTLHRSDSVLPTSFFDLAQMANVVWQVTTNRTGWTSASVKFKYTDAEVAGLTESSIRLYKADALAGPWVEIPSTLDAARNQVSATVTSFSYFALGVVPGDTTDPTLVLQDATIYLDEFGAATVTPADVDAGTTDDVTPSVDLQWSFSQSDFTCSEVGPHSVDVTVTDASGNSASQSVTVTVVDAEPPVAKCTRSVEVLLDENGQGSITVDDVFGASYDNCAITGSELSRSTFDCTDLIVPKRKPLPDAGIPVTLTLSDAAGNSSNDCIISVIVRDRMSPTAVCQDVTVHLDAGGQATISGADVNGGSFDNCTSSEALQFAVNPDTFTCANVGQNTVTLTVTDAQGNFDTCEATVTVDASGNCGPPPDDNDGVPAGVEDAGPNGGDGNADGTPDSQQANVASLPNGATTGINAGQYLTFVSPNNTQLSGISVAPAPSPAPGGVLSFPVGVFLFTVSGPGVQPFPAATEVRITLEQDPVPPISSYYKFAPTTGSPVWFPFNSPVLSLGPSLDTGAVYISGQRLIVLTLTDSAGGSPPSSMSGDFGGDAGIIVDPGGPAVNAPLAVLLSNFTATSTAEGVRLDWATVAELNNAGFNVYRAEGAGLVPLNAAIIPAEGVDGAGTVYSHLDSSTTTGSYYLEDVDLNGTKTLHGPATAASTTAVREWMMY